VVTQHFLEEATQTIVEMVMLPSVFDDDGAELEFRMAVLEGIIVGASCGLVLED